MSPESRTYRNELINKTRQQYRRRRDADKRLIKCVAKRLLGLETAVNKSYVDKWRDIANKFLHLRRELIDYAIINKIYRMRFRQY